MTPRVLVIAGTDSSGGAGVAADLSALAAQGVGARLAVTAVTAQDAGGVHGVWPVSPLALSSQLDRAGTVQAVKIGMLGSPEAVQVVADWLAECPAPVVLDPVMAASAGGILGTPASMAPLLALATLVTPNLPELRALGGDAWLAAHGGAVLIKGGHGVGDTLVDRLVGAGAERRWTHPRRPGTHRGTGCRLASAIAARLAQGESLPAAVAGGVGWLQGVLAATRGVGPPGAR